jgi:hypothetical protein
MPSSRTLASLAQLLALFPAQTAVVLLAKHGLRINVEVGRELLDIHNALRDQVESPGCLAVLDEVIRTNGDLSNQIKPRYRFKERYDDLKRCLTLDGYRVEERELTPLDPSITDTPPVEDDLVGGIKTTDLDPTDAIVGKLNDSAESFRRNPPDYNACLTNARVALESIAREIARHKFHADPPEYDPAKWGSIVAHLRNQGFFSLEEERGLVGVYAFLSTGTHRPVGLTEDEACRLGRSLALSMCWYLVKRYQSLGRGDA